MGLGVSAAVLALVAVGLPAPAAVLSINPGGLALETSNVTSGICNPWNPSPSSMAISSPNPSGAMVGDLLNATYEYRVVNYSKSDHGLALYFPTVSAIFPQKNGSELRLDIPATNASVGGAGWSNASLLTGSLRINGTPAFSRYHPAYLTSSKYAVMVAATYGNFTVELRWHWSVYHVKGGTTKDGRWTVPSRSATGAFLPSIFYPAPFVWISSTSGSTAPAGSLYSIGLKGHVNNTWFRIVLEFPNNGTNLHSIFENTTPSHSFVATVPLTFANNTSVAPGSSYLIHVHDHCEAIVRMVTVTAT